MHDGKEFECLVAVGFNGTAILVEYPKDMVNWLLESDWMDEFDWKGIPDNAGLYKCKVTFWFDQGYIDGYPDDSENNWGFIITESEYLANCQAENAKLHELIAEQGKKIQEYERLPIIDCHAENAKLRKVVEAAEKLLLVFCNGYSCSVSEPRILRKCEQWCNTKEKYLLKQALAELESK